MTGQAGGGRWPSRVQASGAARRPTFPEGLSYREGRRTLRDVAERLELSLSETVENPVLDEDAHYPRSNRAAATSFLSLV